jgi:hypothetical protein
LPSLTVLPKSSSKQKPNPSVKIKSNNLRKKLALL